MTRPNLKQNNITKDNMKIMLKFYHLLLAILLLADLPANATGNNQPQNNAKGQRTVRVSGDIQPD